MHKCAVLQQPARTGGDWHHERLIRFVFTRKVGSLTCGFMASFVTRLPPSCPVLFLSSLVWSSLDVKDQ